MGVGKISKRDTDAVQGLFAFGTLHETAGEFAKAMACYERAANLENSSAQYSFALMCHQPPGMSVTKDIAKAVFWYEKAAAQGDCMALTNLGGGISGRRWSCKEPCESKGIVGAGRSKGAYVGSK